MMSNQERDQGSSLPEPCACTQCFQVHRHMVGNFIWHMWFSAVVFENTYNPDFLFMLHCFHQLKSYKCLYSTPVI